MRIFLGIDLDDTTRARLKTLTSNLEVPPKLRVVAPENLHLTLQFLGDVEDGALPAIAAAARTVAAASAPFELTLAAAGTFGAARRARVLWLGVGAGTAELTALADALAQALEPLGFPPDERDYTPHLTLARTRRPLDLCAVVGQIASPNLSMPASELVLFRSHLSSQGARYERLEHYPLGV